MSEISRQRAIIDRRALSEAVALAWAVNANDEATARAALTSHLRDALQTGRGEIRQRFEAGRRAPMAGRDAGLATSFLIDQLIRVLYDVTTGLVYPAANPSAGERISIVAVGGYGRGELAPFSDIDLLFIIPYKETPHCEQAVEFMLYRLCDLGLKIGDSVPSIAECLRQAKNDLTMRT